MSCVGIALVVASNAQIHENIRSGELQLLEYIADMRLLLVDSSIKNALEGYRSICY